MTGRAVKENGGSTVVVRGVLDHFEVVFEIREHCGSTTTMEA